MDAEVLLSRTLFTCVSMLAHHDAMLQHRHGIPARVLLWPRKIHVGAGRNAEESFLLVIEKQIIVKNKRGDVKPIKPMGKPTHQIDTDRLQPTSRHRPEMRIVIDFEGSVRRQVPFVDYHPLPLVAEN